MDKSIPIQSYGELLALYRLIVEGKFSTQPHDRQIAASALVASVADKVAEKLSEASTQEHTSDKRNGRSESRLMTPKRREWDVALKRAASSDLWPMFSADEKRRFADILASPFRFTDVLRDHFIARVDTQRLQ